MRLADLSINWCSSSVFPADFEAVLSEPPVLTLSFQSSPPQCHGIAFFDGPRDHVLQSTEGPSATLCANADWSEAVIYGGPQSDPFHTLPLAAICSRLAAFDGLLLHASLIDFDGSGILFVGNSGIGKTTQAELWHRHLGADILNGDKALVRLVDGTWYAYGLPWRGSSPYCINRRVPLKAIVALGQAPDNRIVSLPEPAARVLPHVFLPVWDSAAAAMALENASELLETVPCWQLQCRPDEDAVQLTRRTVLTP